MPHNTPETTAEKEKAYRRAWRARNRETIAASRRAHYARNRETIAAKKRSYYASNREKMAAKSRAWRARNPEKEAERHLSRKYGLAPGQYDELLAAQGGACAICGKPHKDGGKRLHVDHDHDTGMVRGLLCSACNTVLGMAGEDTSVLRKAVAYLDGVVMHQ